MLILTNDEIKSLLSMDFCLKLLENAYKDLAEGKAVNRPRTDLYLPSTTDQGVYCFKSMEAGLVEQKVVYVSTPTSSAGRKGEAVSSRRKSRPPQEKSGSV